MWRGGRRDVFPAALRVGDVVPTAFGMRTAKGGDGLARCMDVSKVPSAAPLRALPLFSLHGFPQAGETRKYVFIEPLVVRCSCSTARRSSGAGLSHKHVSGHKLCVWGEFWIFTFVRKPPGGNPTGQRQYCRGLAGMPCNKHRHKWWRSCKRSCSGQDRRKPSNARMTARYAHVGPMLSNCITCALSVAQRMLPGRVAVAVGKYSKHPQQLPCVASASEQKLGMNSKIAREMLHEHVWNDSSRRPATLSSVWRPTNFDQTREKLGRIWPNPTDSGSCWSTCGNFSESALRAVLE